ncbi:MAG: hypothetical protein KAR42_05885 [candidate division Zixibacteria bacterium]|nr:hypothetical protein [candidate division Zixibacteria bacterium]
MKIKITLVLGVLLALSSMTLAANLTHVGSNYYSDANDVALKGDYAICAMEYGLMIVDISDYSIPHMVSNVYQNMGHTRGLALVGDYAYIYGNTDLFIYDISDVNNPSYVKSFFVGGTMHYILARGDIIYACRYANGLSVIDAGDPENLDILVTYPTAGSASRITRVSGDTMYCIATTQGLELINNEVPNFVEQLAVNTTLGQISDVSVWLDKLYCVSIFDSVIVIDISDFNSLDNYISSFSYGNPYLIEVRDTIAYVGDVDAGIISYNVADPANADSLSYIEYYGFMSLRDSLITIIQDEWLWCYDNSDPSDLPRYSYSRLNNWANELELVGDTAYLAGKHFAALDISNPSSAPEFIGGCYLENAGGMTVTGDYAFVFCYDSTVKTIDISDAAHPVIIDTLSLPGYLYSITSYGNYLYVTGHLNSLYIIDASNPSTLTIANTLTGLSYSDVLKVHEGFLYVDDVKIFDLTDPLNPSLLGSDFGSGFVSDVAFDSIWACFSVAYSEPYMGAFTIFNIENKETPAYVSYLPLGPEMASISIDYPLAFLTPYGMFASEDIYIINFSDPENPDTAIVFSYEDDFFYSTALQSGYLYAAGKRGLTVLKYSSICGDMNGDGEVNIGDPIYLINWIFKGGPAPMDLDLSDANCDGRVNIADAVYIINYVFRDGPAPCAGCE